MKANRAQRAPDSRARRPLTAGAMAGLEKIAQAARLLREAAAELNADEHECDGCGHRRYADFEQAQARRELTASADKVSKIRKSLETHDGRS